MCIRDSALRRVDERRGSHIDARFGEHFQPVVRQVVFQARHVIAERIHVLAARARLGPQQNSAAMAGLVRPVPRREMQQLVGMRHVAAVVVNGLVAHPVAHRARHAATVRVSTSMSEKCLRDKRSDSFPADRANTSS